MTVEPTDSESLRLLGDSMRTMMAGASGGKLDAGLAGLGWLDMLAEIPDIAIPLVFRLLGETGTHAPVLNDVVLHTAGRTGGGTVPLPFAGGPWVLWERTERSTSMVDDAWGLLARVTLPTYRTFDGSLQVKAGTEPLFDEASRGHETRWDLTLNLRPTSSLRIGASLALQQLRRAADRS